MTYEPPTIEERTAVGGPLIGQPIGSVVFSPAWRRPDDQDEDLT